MTADGSNDEGHDILVDMRANMEARWHMDKGLPIDGEDAHDLVDWTCQVYKRIKEHLKADDVCSSPGCYITRQMHDQHEFVE